MRNSAGTHPPCANLELLRYSLLHTPSRATFRLCRRGPSSLVMRVEGRTSAKGSGVVAGATFTSTSPSSPIPQDEDVLRCLPLGYGARVARRAHHGIPAGRVIHTSWCSPSIQGGTGSKMPDRIMGGSVPPAFQRERRWPASRHARDPRRHPEGRRAFLSMFIGVGIDLGIGFDKFLVLHNMNTLSLVI